MGTLITIFVFSYLAFQAINLFPQKLKKSTVFLIFYSIIAFSLLIALFVKFGDAIEYGPDTTVIRRDGKVILIRSDVEHGYDLSDR